MDSDLERQFRPRRDDRIPDRLAILGGTGTIVHMASPTMSEFRQLISSIREQMTANLSRSDVLRPLGILSAGLLAGLLTSAGLHASDAIVNTLLILLILSVGLYLFSYTFCLLKDRDALRSEKYSIQKMAIEHGIYGDSHLGIVVNPEDTSPALLPTEPPPITDQG